MTSGSMPVYKAVYSHYTGISPVIAQEICYRAGIDGDISTGFFTDAPEGEEGIRRLYEAFKGMAEQIREGRFSPVIIYEKGAPVEFSAVPLSIFEEDECISFDSISQLLEQYYAEKARLPVSVRNRWICGRLCRRLLRGTSKSTICR